MLTKITIELVYDRELSPEAHEYLEGVVESLGYEAEEASENLTWLAEQVRDDLGWRITASLNDQFETTAPPCRLRC